MTAFDDFEDLFRELTWLMKRVPRLDALETTVQYEPLKDLKKELEQTKIHCEIREKALYDIRQLVEPGSEISKIAGKALCYGNYTRNNK